MRKRGKARACARRRNKCCRCCRCRRAAARRKAKRGRPRVGRGSKRARGPTAARVRPVNVFPTVLRHFHVLPADLDFHSEVAIRADAFVNDAGAPAVELPIAGERGYYNLFVNGVMQQGGLYRVTPESVAIAATGQTLKAGTAIVLETVRFRAETA
ncbi:DUF4183 domain-containing protein [Cohnella cellulosilytica]|uniref:DUF4183 domain-containing protein n=1 Tax=Cohnella cellulosilytica TaxID=986710 RepID=A0ABW2F6I7_9BACL